MFPDFGVKNIRLYYLLAIFLNGWFILPNWVFYFLKYLSISQISLIDGIAISIGLLMEVPSGALSDLLGKKKMMIFSSLIIAIACFLYLFCKSFGMFLVVDILIFIGFSFQSGTREAFAYDSLAEYKKESFYSVVASKFTSISIVMSTISFFIGGLLYRFDSRLPFVAWLIFLIISVGIMLQSKEPKVDTNKMSLKNYLNQMKDGFLAIFNKKLFIYIITILGVAIFVKLYQGVVRQSLAGYFGFTGETFGYLLGLVAIPAAYLSFHLDFLIEKIGSKKLLLIVAFFYSLAFFIGFSSRSLYTGIILFFIINMMEKIGEPLVSVLVNERIDSKHRATALSVIALISQIPYVVILLWFSFMMEVKNLSSLQLIYAGFMGCIFIYSLFLFTYKFFNGAKNRIKN